MTDLGGEAGDPTTAPFWAACRQRRLLVQRCKACASHQFYPRPFCLSCDSDRLEWVESTGRATVYSMTTVREMPLPVLALPYIVALVDLDEGPRLLTNLIGDAFAIGDRVILRWRERESLPPLPVFVRAL